LKGRWSRAKKTVLALKIQSVMYSSMRMPNEKYFKYPQNKIVIFLMGKAKTALSGLYCFIKLL